MAAQSARGPDSRQPYVETESEESAASSGSDQDSSEEEEDDDHALPPPRQTPNTGSKRSDPSIAQKNKYATSDSGYSSLTATTASSSQSKKAAAQPSATEKLKQKLAQTLRMPIKTSTPQSRPLPSRRMSQRLEKSARELRSVESREEAAKMTLSGASNRASAGRRPSMPGQYPPSPPRAAQATVVAPASAAPRPVPRPRASTTAQTGGQRPKSYHAGSAPVVYHLATIQSGQPQQFVTPQQQQQQQQQHSYYQAVSQPAQPIQLNTTTAAYYSGSYGSTGYAQTPTSSSPFTPGYAYPYSQQSHAHQMHSMHPQHHQSQHQPPLQPQTQSQHYWPPVGGYTGGYNGALGEFHDQHARRISMTGHGMPAYQGVAYYPEPQPPAHYPNLRRMSQSVQHHSPMFPPPLPRTPVDEGVFFDDDDDPDDYYRGFQNIVDREFMPPPPRPQSSHRPRPPMIHARTTSAAHAPHRLSRSSIEYVPEISPRKTSFEAVRPPSRPGLSQRPSTGSAHSRALVQAHIHAQAEPHSPVKVRRRTASQYGHGEMEPRVMAAEAYQHERTGGFGPSVASEDLPPLSRRTTKTSDTSRDSRGSGSRDSGDKPVKRTNRHSLDKSKLRESHDPGVQLSIGSVRLDVKGGTTMTIKHSNEGMKSIAAPPGPARPASTKPTRESSRVRPERPEAKRYITASGSSRSTNKDRAEVEVPRKRRSSSVQPRIGRDGGRDVADSLSRLRLENESRQSRRSSRSGRTVDT